jgi:hypothetical protein
MGTMYHTGGSAMRWLRIVYLSLVVAGLGGCGAATELATNRPPSAVPSAPTASLIVARQDDLWRLEWPAQTWTQLTHVTPAGVASDPAVSPDGTRLAYTYRPPVPTPAADRPFTVPRTTLVVAPIATGDGSPVIPPLPEFDSLSRPAWAPDGRGLYAQYETLRFAPDGTYLAAGIDSIYLDLTTMVTRTVIVNATAPTPAPDGQSLAVIRPAPTTGAPQLLRYDLATGAETVLLDDPAIIALEGPTWSADGAAIYVAVSTQLIGGGQPAPWRWLAAGQASAHGFGWNVWRVAANGGDVRVLSPERFEDPRMVEHGSTVLVWALTGLWSLDRLAPNQTATQLLTPGSIGGMARVPTPVRP